MVEISADDMQVLVDIHSKSQAQLTQEQRDENKAKLMALMGDAEMMQAARNDAEVTFKTADADADGQLDWAEWQQYAKQSKANAVAKGWHAPETDPADLKTAFDTYVKIQGSGEGLTLATLFACQGKVIAAFTAQQQE